MKKMKMKLRNGYEFTGLVMFGIMLIVMVWMAVLGLTGHGNAALRLSSLVGIMGVVSSLFFAVGVLWDA